MMTKSIEQLEQDFRGAQATVNAAYGAYVDADDDTDYVAARAYADASSNVTAVYKLWQDALKEKK